MEVHGIHSEMQSQGGTNLLAMLGGIVFMFS